MNYFSIIFTFPVLSILSEAKQKHPTKDKLISFIFQYEGFHTKT
jgi:hypothetical protein